MNIKCSYTELVDTHKLTKHPKNPNKHSKEQIERLSKIIDYQGQRSPVVVSKLSGFVVVGHGRLEAMKKLGWEKIAVDYQEFENEAQEYAHLTADNAIAEWAQLDLSQINMDILDLGPDLDLDMLGLKDFVVEPLEKLEGLTDEDEVPEVIHPITRRGDIWILANHRLMCGDSTMIDDVEKLMNGEKADMVFTDPPYGINENTDRDFAAPSRKAKGGKFSKIIGDETTDVAYSFCNLWLGLNVPKYIIWGCNHFAHALPESPEWLAWDKRIEDKQRDHNSDIELAWVKSGKKSARIFRHLWKGMIKGSENGQKRVHPTQKPIELAVWCFNEYDAGNNVFDGFLGSGSTLIACEKTNKRCFGMELDAHYCDVIINRWQNFTGKKAILELTKQTYEELKQERLNG